MMWSPNHIVVVAGGVEDQRIHLVSPAIGGSREDGSRPALSGVKR
jgi:hypothetical protein